MAGIQLDQVKAELGAYFRANNREVRSWVYAESQLAKYARVITKVQGKFPAFRSVTDHIVQGFRAQWDELGTTKFKVNELTAYHQKVNFPIVPSDILNSWLAFLYQENLTREQMPISKYIAQMELSPKVKEDIADLEINGVYDAADLQTYGKSMNGIMKVLANGITSSDNPMYKIPLPAITEDNAVDVITTFEKKLPKKVGRRVKRIFLSTYDFEKYVIDFTNKYGAVTWKTEGDTVRSFLGKRELVPLDFMPEGSQPWATIDGNLCKLIDIFDQPQVTDIQTLDYKVKIFMEFWLGYGFWVNEAVFVGVTEGSGSGLATDNDLYHIV